MKTVSTIQLCSCCGCHVALVNIGVELFAALKNTDLIFSPVLKDTKTISRCDIAFVEGGVRNDENISLLQKLRSNAQSLVSLGTCSCFGGIPGIGSAYAREEMLQQAYGTAFVPDHIPVLEQRVSPIDRFVTVDYYIPGCPPPAGLIKDTILKLLKGETPDRKDLPVCAECTRVAQTGLNTELKRTTVQQPEPDVCLLSQGYVCLGSVSRSGCGAPCTSAGVPCMGCRGPIDRVFVEPTHGIFYDLIRRISHFTGKSEEDVEKCIEDVVHTLYSFTLSIPELRRKDAERVASNIRRIKV
jgi:F420-non-reducing hydrogenase small subunit